MFADAEDSDMAYLLQIALPTRAWNQMNKFLGDKKMRFVEAVTDRFLIFVYLFIVLGCWCVVFFYIYPWITFVDSISNIHKYIGYFVFVSCFGSWRLTNTSSPGSINSQSFKRYDHYPYDHLLFLPGKRCGSTNLIKIPRSKFDRIKYKRNIPRYDHFCGWVHNTIGEENYRWFLLFLAVHVVMCAYGSLVCMLLFRAEIKEKKLLELTFFDRATGTSIQSSWSIVAQYLFAQKTLEASVMIIMFFMAIALGMFLSYHVSSIFYVLKQCMFSPHLFFGINRFILLPQIRLRMKTGNGGT
jgi:palmitoyltransferase